MPTPRLTPLAILLTLLTVHCGFAAEATAPEDTPQASAAQVVAGPSVRVDFDMAGRPSSEVSELGYAAWPVTEAPSISRTFEGVQFTFARVGPNGTGLRSDWYKAGVGAPSNARLVGDGLTVVNGDAGAQIQLTMRGLAAGSHTLLVYLNQTMNPEGRAFAPVDVLVDGKLVLDDVPQSVRALRTSAARSAYLGFEAQAGRDVVVLFRADTSARAPLKNVMLNGFELDTPDATKQANTPSPADADEHVAAESGALTLTWKPASGAASHDVYFGTDAAALRAATPASPEFRGNQTAASLSVRDLYSLHTYYWRVDEVDRGGARTRGNVWYFRPRQLAFPGAEGYGRFARGGRGGVVVHVSNLNDSGPGSLRAAIEGDLGPRTVVFDVGGVIKLASRLTLSQSHVTVAGQTAPGKGIVIRAAPFGMSGARDAVVQHVRVRLGAGPTFDGMGMQGSDHAIIDHSAISWTIDEAFSSRSAKNITLQRTLISECLNIAGHQNYPPGTKHGYAASISGDVGSFHHNLLAHCEGRNWSLAGGLDGAGSFAGRLDIFNNVVYNWGGRSTDGGAHEVNFVGNYYKPGPATTLFVALDAQYENFPGTQRYYFDRNVMPGRFDERTQASGRRVSGRTPSYGAWVSAPFFPSYATVQSAADAYKSVLSDVGATQPVLDDHDRRVVKETLSGTAAHRGSVSRAAGLPDHERDVGGLEDYPRAVREPGWDSDGDGLPDWWERNAGSDPRSGAGDFADARADADHDGFTQLDDYLAFMAKPHALIARDAALSTDLSEAFAGYTSGPTYTSSSVVNGAVTISGKTATFHPSACGLASWRLTVRDAAGSTMTKDYAAHVGAGALGTEACP